MLRPNAIRWWTVVGIAVLMLACNLFSPQTATPVAVTPTTIQSPTLPPDMVPTPYVCQASVVEQPFEHGFMFWVGRSTEEKCRLEHSFTPGSGEIWVAIFDASRTGGKWLVFEDDWDESKEPEMNPTLTPPAGLMQPVRGFGKVWRDRLTEDQRQQLGWGNGIELPFATDYRYEGSGFVNAQGEFVPRPGKHVLRGLAGDVFTFDETTESFEYIPPE
jgi:hypothetical protein